MLSPIRHVPALGVLFCMIGPLLGAEERLARQEIAKRAKAATVLVEVKPSSGSGFCVHSSGLFVTNEHVVRQAGSAGAVTLVLNAGLKTQRVLKAKVLRRDKKLDLALLQVEGEKQFQAMTLGSDKELVELAELIAVGFPFGTALAKPGEYPTISVNVGSVTSLRRDSEGELHRIQLDAVLNPGNSGGPVLDGDGKVVGVVVAGIRGAGINLAIPVRHLRQFLARPEILFTPPVVKRSTQHDSFDFTAKTVSLLSSSEPLDLELILGAGTKEERLIAMKFADGSHHAKAVLFPARKGPLEFRLEVNYNDGSVSGMVEDRTIHVGEKTVKLSQVRGLRLGRKPEVQLSDGQKLDGSPSDLETISVKVGKQSLRLNLASAAEIKVNTPEEANAISCTILARQAGKEVGRLSVPLYIEGLGRPSLEALSDGKFVKPPRSSTPISSLRVVSSKGDYIGQGKSYSYSGDELTVRRTPRGVSIAVDGWNILFGGPGNRFLEVGEYLNAKRHPFSGASPGIEFSGNGRGCNMIAGKFVVWELEMKGNEIVRLAIDFIQRCEGRMPPLYGTIRINSSFH